MLFLMLGQDSASPSASVSDAAAAVGGLIGGGCTLLWCGLWLAVWLFCGIFVTKDAKRRNSPNATLVIILSWIPIFPIFIIGLIVHLATRPKTDAGTSITPPPPPPPPPPTTT